MTRLLRRQKEQIIRETLARVTAPAGGTGGAGATPWTSITGTPSTLTGYGIVAPIARGGTIYKADGISTPINFIVWRAPFACTVTNVRGYRNGGTGATINAQKNGSLTHLASALSLTAANTWMDGGAVQNTPYAAGDKLEIMLASAAGLPDQIAIQVDFTRP